MRVDLFDFELDKELIAKEPVNPRHNSKLLDLSDDIVIEDKHFYDLPNILQSGDVLVTIFSCKDFSLSAAVSRGSPSIITLLGCTAQISAPSILVASMVRNIASSMSASRFSADISKS